jgi:hypothetical protein
METSVYPEREQVFHRRAAALAIAGEASALSG